MDGNIAEAFGNLSISPEEAASVDNAEAVETLGMFLADISIIGLSITDFVQLFAPVVGGDNDWGTIVSTDSWGDHPASKTGVMAGITLL
jgi:hypothetical protein